MEYCAVQGPQFPNPIEIQRCDVQRFGKLVLAAVFQTGEPQIINLLADNFLPAVMKIMKDCQDFRSAVNSAFTKMDRLVKEELKVDLSTKDLTAVCVVDLPEKVVYSTGSFLEVHASIVSHDSSTRQLTLAERLEPGDRHLVLATRRVNMSMVGDIGAVLETRIRQVGLVEACKTILGKYADLPKTLIVITLREDAHLPYPDQPLLPAAGAWEERLRRKLQVLDLEGVAYAGDDNPYFIEDARRFYKNPWAHVRPLREGETCQQPEPYATALYIFRGKPGPLGTIEAPRVSEGLRLDVNKEPERQEAVEGNKKTEPRRKRQKISHDPQSRRSTC